MAAKKSHAAPRAAAAPANAAIYYQRDAFSTEVPKLMGRNAAGAGFLAGFARHAGVRPFLGYAASEQEFGHFRAFMSAQQGAADCAWIEHGDLNALAGAGTLFVYAPGIADFCWQRRFASPAAWSVVGLTHTISSDRVMGDIGELLVGPVERWDALVCTSKAIRGTVLGVLEGYGAYLAGRFKARKISPRPELP